jgi:hypothetical protein
MTQNSVNSGSRCSLEFYLKVFKSRPFIGFVLIPLKHDMSHDMEEVTEKRV